MLRKAGFTEKPAKGSHTKWSHHLLSGKIILSGMDRDDAKSYQEKDVEQAIEKIQEIQNKQGEE
jgi:predicted RNA binding protein YcfA (HicA-like mRNA interferase family)